MSQIRVNVSRILRASWAEDERASWEDAGEPESGHPYSILNRPRPLDLTPEEARLLLTSGDYQGDVGGWADGRDSHRNAIARACQRIRNELDDSTTGAKTAPEGGRQVEATAVKKGRVADPKSTTNRMLRSAVKAVKESDAGQLTRKEIDAKVRIRTEGSTTPGFLVSKAAQAGKVVDGHRFVRVERATYKVEEVDESS